MLDVPFVREPYPEGEAGIQKSLEEMCVKVRESAPMPVFRSFAGNILRQAHFPRSNKEKSSAFFKHVQKTVGYTHDPPGTELIQSPMITLCVEGAPVCIPIEDCFPEGTLLLREDYALVPIEQIKVGDRIWGHDKWTRVEAKTFKGKLAVDAIEMNNGSTVYLTSDHKVFVGRCRHGKSVECPTCRASAGSRLESFDRIHVSDLVEGESLLQPDRISFGDGEPDPDRMYIEGLALADGWTEPSCFKIAGRDGMRKEAQKHEVKAICERLGISTHWHRRYITVKDSAWGAHIASLGSRARFKRAETLNLGEAAAAALLRGLMADSTPDSHGVSRTYSTTSYTMAVQVRVLHRMFGRRTSMRMLTPEQHKGAGKHPLWRVGVRADSQYIHAEKALAVRSIERAVAKVPCWDIQTEDHYVYLPEHDVTVSNCDGMVVALSALNAAAGLEVEIVRQFFGKGHQQHVICEVKLEDGSWFPLDVTTPRFGPGEKAKASYETRVNPWKDGGGKGLSAEFVGIGGLPVFGLGEDGSYHQLPNDLVLGADDPPKVWYDVGHGVQMSRALVRPLRAISEGLNGLGEIEIPKLSTKGALVAGGAIVAGSAILAAIIRKVKRR